MRINSGVRQKIKGKVQKLKGEIQQATGHEVKGAISKMRGSTNDVISDIKLNSGRTRSKGII